MATAQRILGDRQAQRIRENARRRSSPRTTGRGKIYLDIDVSSFVAKLHGLDSKYIASSRTVMGIMYSAAAKVAEDTRVTVRPAWSRDTRTSIRSIHAAYDVKGGKPKVSVTASQRHRQEEDWPGYKPGTNRFKKYQGADRGMLVYWWNAGIVKKHKSAKGIFTKTARAGLERKKDDILRAINKRVIEPKLGGHVAQHNT